MKIICDCGNEIGKNLNFHTKDVELDEFPVCEKCGKKWYLYVLARESTL